MTSSKRVRLYPDSSDMESDDSRTGTDAFIPHAAHSSRPTRLAHRLQLDTSDFVDEDAPLVDPARVSIISPADARRLGLTPEIFARTGRERPVVEPLSVQPVQEKRGATKSKGKKGSKAAKLDPFGAIMGPPPSRLTGAPTPRATPLSSADELLADYIALHDAIDPPQIAKELKIPEVEVAAGLNNLIAHGLILHGEKGPRPAPDLIAQGKDPMFNAFLDPVVTRLTSETARERWLRVIGRVARGWQGNWRSTKTAVTWRNGKRQVIGFYFNKTSMRFVLNGVAETMVDPALIKTLKPAEPVEKKDARGKRTLEFTVRDPFDADRLVDAVRKSARV